MSERKECPICKSNATWSSIPGQPNVGVMSGCNCPHYVILHQDIECYLANWTNGQTQRLCTLLWERDYKALPGAFLQFERPDYIDVDRFVPVSAADLLRTWPHEIPRRIDRCLCNLVEFSKNQERLVGQPYQMALKDPKDRILFSDDRGEKEYFIEAMARYRWIGESIGGDVRLLTLTPEGYARFDELTRGQANSKNPVFVAMWFGGENKKEDMSLLFEAQIEIAINKAGYMARRADTGEHNEPIMDRVHDYIRQAPFVVAELTGDNSGVYYEAGFARGLGTEIIYACPRDTRPHFDVTAINLVKWDTRDDLRKKLENRILGTVKRGPYSSDELARTRRSDPT